MGKGAGVKKSGVIGVRDAWRELKQEHEMGCKIWLKTGRFWFRTDEGRMM